MFLPGGKKSSNRIVSLLILYSSSCCLYYSLLLFIPLSIPLLQIYYHAMLSALSCPAGKLTALSSPSLDDVTSPRTRSAVKSISSSAQHGLKKPFCIDRSRFWQWSRDFSRLKHRWSCQEPGGAWRLPTKRSSQNWFGCSANTAKLRFLQKPHSLNRSNMQRAGRQKYWRVERFAWENRGLLCDHLLVARVFIVIICPMAK